MEMNQQNKTVTCTMETLSRLRGIRNVFTQMPCMFVSTGDKKRHTIFNTHNKPDFLGS